VLDATCNNDTLVFFVGAGTYVVAAIASHFIPLNHREDLVDRMAGVAVH
jgi:hypothetical protein